MVAGGQSSSIIVVILTLLGDNRGDTREMAITATARRDRCYIRQDKLLHHTFIVNMRMYSDSDAALSKNKDHLKISISLKAKKCCSLQYTVVFISKSILFAISNSGRLQLEDLRS